MNISVVIPAYNVEDTVAQTLDALLHQSRIPDEIIIVDNASKDNTVEKVKGFIKNNPSVKIILDRENKKGPSPVRNKGAELSKGEVIAFLDADCIPPSNWIGIIEEELAEGTDVVGGAYKEYDTKTFIRRYLDMMERATVGKRKILKADVHNDRFVFAGNFAIKKDLFFKVGKFDEEMKIGEDVDLSKRIYRFGKAIIYNPEAVVVHNHKETFKGRFKKAFGYGLLQAKFFKKYFDRELNIVFSSRKTVSFKFPFKIRLQFFSIFYPLLLLIMLSFFNVCLAAFLTIFFIIGINLKIFNLITKSDRKINFFTYILFLLYWTMERVVFDIGRIFGSFKYKVICI